MKIHVSISVSITGDNPQIALTNPYEDFELPLDIKDAESLIDDLRTAISTLKKLQAKE
jgi:hypothetical protein